MAEELHNPAQDPPSFRWTPVREEAALLVALDDLTDEKIAEKLEISRRTLHGWKEHPGFRARVDAHLSEFRERVRRRGIALVENRVTHLQRRHDLLNRVITERGEDPGMQRVPGGSTGLLVHNVKAIGSGEFAERVDLYEVDTGALSELRQIEKQAAQELGQWAEKVDGSMTLYTKEIRGVSEDDV